jgi:hypothetical protein
MYVLPTSFKFFFFQGLVLIFPPIIYRYIAFFSFTNLKKIQKQIIKFLLGHFTITKNAQVTIFFFA